MIKLNPDFTDQQQKDFGNQQAHSQNQANFNQNQQSPPLNQPKGLLTLPPAVLQMVPWIPLMLEMTTGQKVPQMTGTIGEIQTALQQIQVNLAQVLQSQAQIWNKLTSLESNAVQQLTEIKTNNLNQFTSLNQQVQNIQSIRLTHSKESKAIEYNNQPRPNSEESY